MIEYHCFDDNGVPISVPEPAGDPKGPETRTNRKKRDVYMVLREAGMTYKEIADIFGVTRQAVEVSIRRAAKTRRKSVYPAAHNFMQDNRMSVFDFACCAEKKHLSNSTHEYHRWLGIMSGKKTPNKCDIDKMLTLIGCTYEELFEMEEPE